jgi:hypothetical protein
MVNRWREHLQSLWVIAGVYPSLAGIADRLQEGILNLWQTIHPFVGEDNYVVSVHFTIKAFLICARGRWTSRIYPGRESS